MEHSNAISSKQIKAARALLDWSQDDLAHSAQLSIATIRKLELGFVPRCSTASTLRRAFEASGIEFLDSEGVRLRREDIEAFRGDAGAEAFLEDIVQTARKGAGELMVVASSPQELCQMFAMAAMQDFEEAVARCPCIGVKIIFSDAFDLPLSGPRVEYRSLSSNYVDPMPFCVYGNKYAIVMMAERGAGKIVVVQSPAVALSSRRQFLSMWEKAVSFQALCSEAKKVRALRA